MLRSAHIAKHHHRKNHDYFFCPAMWIDSSTGQQCKSGYYDENGSRYDALADFDANTNEYYTADAFQCEYCGSQVRTRWQMGAAPQCPNCGAALQKIAYDEPDNIIKILPDGTQEWIENGYRYRVSPNGSYSKVLVNWKPIVIFLVAFFVVPFILMIGGMGIHVMQTANGNAKSPNIVVEESAKEHEPIYVDSLGREIKWDYESGNYYDASTDCYVYRNFVDGNWVWQYWYEGISSDYSSGWMEWDKDDTTGEYKWFIETTDGNWIELPEKYLSDRLWHMG